MRVAPYVALGLLGLALPGCSLFGKKQAATPSPPPRATADPRPDLPARNPPLATAPAASPTDVGGILAGQVIDRYHLRPPATTIEVTQATANPAGQPREVEADGQGYFTIKGLKPGRYYQLTAHARTPDGTMTGTTFATPPDAKVIIQISINAPVINPPPPPNGALPQEPSQAKPQQIPSPSWPDRPSAGADQAWAPGRNAGPEAGQRYPSVPGTGSSLPPVELGPPAGFNGMNVSPRPHLDIPPAQPSAGFDPSKVAGGGQAVARGDPLIDLDSQKRKGSFQFPASPGRVPFCDLTGYKLYNFALNDLNGQPWEFLNHQSKLVLIDFWGTWCPYCVQEIPHLNVLQQRYGSYGLQVVGIAYEKGTIQEQIQKVARLQRLKGIKYQLLLGGDSVRSPCPVKVQFRVTSWPTLVLLDEHGYIVTRVQGLDGPQMRELEILIRQHLGLQ